MLDILSNAIHDHVGVPILAICAMNGKSICHVACGYWVPGTYTYLYSYNVPTWGQRRRGVDRLQCM